MLIIIKQIADLSPTHASSSPFLCLCNLSYKLKLNRIKLQSNFKHTPTTSRYLPGKNLAHQTTYQELQRKIESKQVKSKSNIQQVLE